jgi:hypothetical protein
MIIINGKEWQILIEEENVLHLIDSYGNGMCILKSEL